MKLKDIDVIGTEQSLERWAKSFKEIKVMKDGPKKLRQIRSLGNAMYESNERLLLAYGRITLPDFFAQKRIK